MEKDNKILLGAVLILVVAMLSFNFNTLTGKATSTDDKVTVTVSPASVDFDEDEVRNGYVETVTITVDTDKRLDNLYGLKLYQDVPGGIDNLYNQGTVRICEASSYCDPKVYTVTAKINQGMLRGKEVRGDFFYKVKVKNGEKHNSNTFTVTKWQRGYEATDY